MNEEKIAFLQAAVNMPPISPGIHRCVAGAPARVRADSGALPEVPITIVNLKELVMRTTRVDGAVAQEYDLIG